jgi:hypothetical protein
MKSPSDSRQAAAKVASQVRGRLRVKFGRHWRHKAKLEEIERYLEAQPGIGDVIVNPTTGSMTIPYDHAKQDGDGIFRLLQDLDVVMESTLHAPSLDEAAVDNGHRSLSDAIDDLNAYVRKSIGVPVNLRLMLPIGLVAAGMWQIARRGWMVENVPGWVFLWLAFDTFVKLHPERAPAPHGAAGRER